MSLDHALDLDTRPGRVSAELQHDVEQFLYDEADLLDSGQFREWLDLIGDDITYQVKTRPTVEAHHEAIEPAALAFDDDRQSLTWRVKRAETGMAWAEEPASRTRYLITNVRIAPAQGDDLLVRCNFLRYRNRLETTEHFLLGSRQDTLRPHNGSYLLTRRIVTLDQNVISSNNLSMLF
jgi:3-phenylpropionate/cinnamic acid dioxygenase small subunit